MSTPSPASSVAAAGANWRSGIAACAPAKLKGSCVHVKRLADVDPKALKALIVAAVKARKR